MKETFLATLTPMLMLFLCIAVGFLLKKCKILPDNGAKVMAKLETWVFCPALSFATMARFFTVKTITLHATNILISIVCVALAMAIAIPLSYVFVKEKSYDRGVYQYALTFANLGYIGDPLVLALFGEEVLSYYKLATLPFTLVIYVWGISVLVPQGEKKESVWKKLFNVPMVAMLIGIAAGLICGAAAGDVPEGTTAYDMLFPAFIVSTMDGLKACMGPVAMLIAGFTIASYDFKKMLLNKKVYVATALRLIVIPVVILAALFGLKELANLLFGLSIDNTPLILLFFALAAPLGLNTVVFPEAYGGNPETGASMAMISHTLCVLTIPIMFALIMTVFGGNTWLVL
ncbi:MAG: AEC family transporter [Clostridia bacterium]|nr:AEC family transporter [Clostridia bacterium]